MKRVVPAALALALLVPSARAASQSSPVVVWKTASFGTVLATRGHLALYTWRKERAGTIRCTGSCAKAWPPLVIPAGASVAKHVAGVKGTFGTIRRPDGRKQVTFAGRPLYTYESDTPTKILCNGVDGWFVVRV